MKKKEELYSCSQQDHSAVVETDIKMVPIAVLHDFEGHPFKVENDMALFELMQSIEKEGVIVPALARPRAEGCYELIAGHRRKAASKWAGLDVMPVVIRELDDNQAVIAMVDSNLQREHLKPSEKAFAYKMKLEAMKRQGARTDLTSSQVGKKLTSSQVVTETSDQVGPKSENPTMKIYPLQSGHDENGNWLVQQEKTAGIAINSNETLAKQMGESRMTIQRYIRLTNLIPKLLDMVDEGKIAFTIAVELSYLTEEEQYELYEVMNMEQCTPSLSQANRMKRMSQSGELDMDGMFLILEQEKPNQREQIKLRADALAKYFPEDYTPKQKTDLIERLVKEWYEKQELDKTQSQGNNRGRAR
jgi:ParB family transcriptional regulator, chromosome partitioning protein